VSDVPVCFAPDWVEEGGLSLLSTDTVEGGFRSDGPNGGEEEIARFDVQAGGGCVLTGFGSLEVPDGSGVWDVCEEDPGTEVGERSEEGGWEEDGGEENGSEESDCDEEVGREDDCSEEDL